MKASICRLAVLSLFCSPALFAGEIRLALVRTANVIQISFATETGKVYELESATDLSTWGKGPLTKTGDGQTVVHDLGAPAEAMRFFRLVVRDASAGLAPTPEQAAGLFVGGTWDGYQFTSTNRFEWNGEAGNWSYQKIGPDTGLLVLTYDSDGNDPGVYREEEVLNFVTAMTGTYRYSEFSGGVEDPGSVWTGDMDLTSLFDLSPTPAQMAARLVGMTWGTYLFKSATRFEWSGSQGNWSYQKTGRNTGLIVFTYDEDNNDPQVYREEVKLTFTSATSGTYRYSEYYHGQEYPPSVIPSVPFSLP